MKKSKIIISIVMLLLYGLSMFCVSYIYTHGTKIEVDPVPEVKTEKISTKNDELYSSSSYNQIRALIYPVGSIYITTVDDTVEKVKARFGGTWAAFSTGRVLVGVDTSDTDFDTVQESGGAKKHRHEVGDLRAQIGAYNSTPSAIGYVATSATNPATGAGAGTITYGIAATSYTTKQTFNHYTPVKGYVNEKSHVPPYVVVYMYKRTA